MTVQHNCNKDCKRQKSTTIFLVGEKKSFVVECVWDSRMSRKWSICGILCAAILKTGTLAFRQCRTLLSSTTGRPTHKNKMRGDEDVNEMPFKIKLKCANVFTRHVCVFEILFHHEDQITPEYWTLTFRSSGAPQINVTVACGCKPKPWLLT